jgi:lipopolysaccharide transport system ATP-binding protein
MSLAIKVEDLSKRYRLGVINRDMLYKDLQSRWAKFRGKPDPNEPVGHVHQDRIEKGDEFWALRNVNLEIPEGSVFGVIGRNGAGKSTLLKILSQITAPTEGQIKIKGRVASLLEVGTGFHPELTGRENIFLNGAILGMTRKEVSSKFDEIVAFSEIEEFIDTPVKRYSSGMYVRLAFAVAAHLDPEILVVDEVLAVGDASFQKKCLGKMQDVSGYGRTVVFVSHNMTMVSSLCSECVLLNNGGVEAQGPAAEITAKYYASVTGEAEHSDLDFGSQGVGDDKARLFSARLIGPDHESISFVNIDQPFGIEMNMEVCASNAQIVPNLHFYTKGHCAFVASPSERAITEKGRHRVVMWVPPNFLNDGLYEVILAASTMAPTKIHFCETGKFFLTVVDDIHSKHRNGFANAVPGSVRPLFNWDMDKI